MFVAAGFVVSRYAGIVTEICLQIACGSSIEAGIIRREEVIVAVGYAFTDIFEILGREDLVDNGHKVLLIQRGIHLRPIDLVKKGTDQADRVLSEIAERERLEKSISRLERGTLSIQQGLVHPRLSVRFALFRSDLDDLGNDPARFFNLIHIEQAFDLAVERLFEVGSQRRGVLEVLQRGLRILGDQQHVARGRKD